MFDFRQYVPVIRWKRGEYGALRSLTTETRRCITPIVELIPKNFDARKLIKSGGFNGRLDEIASEIQDSWGVRPFFLDLSHVTRQLRALPPNSYHIPGAVFAKHELVSIPVASLRSSSIEIAVARELASRSKQGVALRVTSKDLIDSDIDSRLAALMVHLGQKREEAHLIIDLQVVTGNISLTDLCGRLGQLRAWRTFCVVGGAFMKNLSAIPKNTQFELSRHEWTNWRNAVTSPQGLTRLPSFGDYTVQYAHYEEPPPNFNVSASIRYTSEEYWVIMRGEGVQNENGPGYRGYLGNAMLLTERPEYCGEHFSDGDRYIAAMSAQEERTGSAETWIRAAINHHLTFAVRQIARTVD